MKISISTDNGSVSEHFGRCPQFTIVEIIDNKVKDKKTIDNPGHNTGGSLPEYLKEIGVDTVIAGGAGPRAVDFFRQYNINLITGITGTIDEVITQVTEGKLKTKDSTCSPGAGKGYGIRKEDGHE